jgi:integrase
MCESHDMGALWMLAICTARREAELLGLHWTDVAWECGAHAIEEQTSPRAAQIMGEALRMS